MTTTQTREIPRLADGFLAVIDTSLILATLRALPAERQKRINDAVSERCAWSDPTTYYETLWALIIVA